MPQNIQNKWITKPKKFKIILCHTTFFLPKRLMTVHISALKIKMKNENEFFNPLQPLTQNIQNKWITKPINLRSFCATRHFFCQKD